MMVALHLMIYVDKHCLCPCYAFVLKCYVYSIAFCLITLIVGYFSHLDVHASPAHLYIHQLFAQCLSHHHLCKF